MPQMHWKLNGLATALHLNALSASIDLAQPRDGLSQVVIAEHRLAAARLLGLDAMPIADAKPIENYVRGTDLFVAYEESSRWPVRVDLLWRAIAPRPADRFLAAVELIVSVRTDLLDGHPELAVQSTVPSNEALRLQDVASANFTAVGATPLSPASGTSCLLFRWPGVDVSYAEMVHPADFQHDELSQDRTDGSTMRVSHRLFRTSLEKGVILRARVRGVFVHRRGDTEAAAECYAALAAADPPLDA